MNTPLAPPLSPKRLAEIAAMLTCSDEQFDRAFRSAQSPRGREPYSIFSRSKSRLTGQSLFKRGLRLAKSEGWLDALLAQLEAYNFDNGRLPSHPPTRAEGPLEMPQVQPEANVRGLGIFDEPEYLERGSRAASRYCGQVLIDDAARGSGFLIGPDLFLTAWHVVKDLIKPGPNTAAGERTWIAKPAPQLVILFNKVRRWDESGQRLTLDYQRLRPVKVARDWLETGAPPPELQGLMPAPNNFRDDWDYAVIRLAEPIGNDYAPALLENRPLPPLGDRLWIFQFPESLPLKYQTHDFLGVYGKGQERFYYRVETSEGSSGGPCLDKEFRVVGMHLAAWIKGTPAIDGALVNFGVPAAKLFAHANARPAALMPRPTTARLRRLRDDTDPVAAHPVVGRWDFQLLVWNELIRAARRRIVIVPDDGTPGRGKSFLAHVLESMLPTSMNLMAMVSAEALSTLTLKKGYDLLLARLGAVEPEVTRPRIVGAMPSLRTTSAALTSDSLVPAFIRKIGNVRGERMVWIVIDELDRYEIENSELREFLYLLYQQVLTVPWLRIMLVGFKGDMPALGQAQAYVLRYPENGGLEPLSAQDVKEHIVSLIGDYDGSWTNADIDRHAATAIAEAGDRYATGFAEKLAGAVLKIEYEIMATRRGGP